MTTREIYSAIITGAALISCVGLLGWGAALALIAGMVLSHVPLDWIPAEPLDEE